MEYESYEDFMKREYPNWKQELCYSCGGSGHSWRGDGLGICGNCKGNCGYWIHKPSGVRAAYPGGPFV